MILGLLENERKPHRNPFGFLKRKHFFFLNFFFWLYIFLIRIGVPFSLLTVMIPSSDSPMVKMKTTAIW